MPSDVDRVRARLVSSGGDVSPARVAAALRAERGLRGDPDPLATTQVIQDEVTGAGPLASLLREPGVTDVLVNAPGDVWVDRGHGLERASVSFANDAAVRQTVQRLIARSGRRLDAAQPWVDVRLDDGTRLHAILPPLATRATCVSLRVPRRRAFTLPDLEAAGSVAPAMAHVLRAVVDARLAVVVSGGTGTGKTTLLSTLLGLVDERERIVVVEDAAELRPDRPHVVTLESRPRNVEGAGEVTLRDLVRQALRMRPDRLVVGEVRGAEVVEMLAALNTGHDGGMTTVHANEPADVPARFEALAATAGLSREALHSQLAAALDVCVHLQRDRAGLRRVAVVSVAQRGAAGDVSFVPAFVDVPDRGPARRAGATTLARRLAARGIAWPAPRR
ncbi:MAG: TadA family conjugal transfer-associated ATPase [Frankia sp.]|nr:TadA family conjugal transfer-associated ATPase [Frankia sp.]